MALAIVICTIAIMRGVETIALKLIELKRYEIANSKYQEWLDDRTNNI